MDRKYGRFLAVGGLILVLLAFNFKSEGEFTLDDRSWGVISKPAYTQHLSQEIARAIAERLPQDVFTYAPGR
ncbi:MAG: hypothetical protein R6X34_12660 [Chloroflexota bacterium]